MGGGGEVRRSWKPWFWNDWEEEIRVCGVYSFSDNGENTLHHPLFSFFLFFFHKKGFINNKKTKKKKIRDVSLGGETYSDCIFHS